MEVQQVMNDSAAFLSYGGYHHHLGLNVWESRGASAPPRRSTGLYHVAFLFPTRLELARVVKRVIESGTRIDGMSDHGVSEAIYLRDPDDNGIEIYWDKPKDQWPYVDGRLQMTIDPLDFEDLLTELGSSAP